MPLPLKPGPDLCVLAALFLYDAGLGRLRRRCTKGGHTAGSVAGNVETSGYRVVKIQGSTYKEHRAIFALCTGAWPAEEVDHIDGDITNNRIENLREVSRKGNAQNLRKAIKNSRSGLIGAQWNAQAGRWRSKIICSGTTKFLGYFDTPEAAHEAYLRAKRELHATCTI